MKWRARDGVFLLLWSCMTLVMGTLCLPALISRSASQKVAKHWAWATLWLVARTSGISSHVRGYQNIASQPAIYAAKHQSAWDTFMLWSTLKKPAFVLKRGLYLVPVFGWFLWRSGQIAIDRRDGKRAIDTMVKQATRYAKAGREIVIFPEGTRTVPGAPTRYKMGVAHLAEALQLPVVPVALNAGKLWPRHLLKKRSGSAVMEFLPAMPPAGAAKEPWLDDLAGRIEKASEQLLKHE